MGTSDTARWWAALVGIVLIAVGLIGFIDNPLVGKAEGTFVVTNEVHNLVHLATGALALYVAFGLRASARASGLIGFGILYGVIFGAVVLSPSLFGLFGDYASGPIEHVIHGSVAVVSIGVGYLARGRAAAMA